MRYLPVLCLLMISLSAQAQKIKYKDLFPLLDAGQYDAAEANLRRFLAANDDTPNAYLQMGKLLNAKFLALDVLQVPDRAAQLGDSAVYYFELSLKSIDEKEIKRHDDYYQSFAQRDQRTGSYGVDLENIRYDLKKKIADIKDRQQRIVRLTKAFRLSSATYVKNQESFKKLTTGFTSYNDFLLRSDQNTVQVLRRIKERHDSVENQFRSFKSYFTQLGNAPYTPVLKMQDVQNMVREGSDPADFFAHEVTLWNFRSFADQSIEIIERDILPLQDNLLRIETDLLDLANRVNKDSVSVLTDVSKIQQRLAESNLLKYDPDPLPFAVFRLKIADLQYSSEIMAGRADHSSGNLVARLARLRREIRAVEVMDSVATAEISRDLKAESVRYNKFVRESFGDIETLTAQFRTTLGFTKSKRDELRAEIDGLKSSIRFLNDGDVKIPVSPDVSADGYYPLYTDPENYTIGVRYLDGLHPQGYFYQITPSRQAALKADIPLDSGAFAVAKAPLFKALMTATPSGDVLFPILYSTESLDGKINVVVSKVYKVDGLAWTFTFPVEGTPVAATFIRETGGLSLTLETTTGQIIYRITKDGKIP